MKKIIGVPSRTVICDECQEEFIARETETWCIKEGKIIAGEPVRVRAFMCPKCKRIYITSVMTQKMIEDAEKIQKARLSLEEKQIQLRNKFCNKIEKGNKI